MKQAMKLTAISFFLLFMSLGTSSWATPAEEELNHFQCYDVKDQTKLDPTPVVDLTDRYSSQTDVEVDGKNAKKYCTPVSKNDEGFIVPDGRETTLLCYKVKSNRVDEDVVVVNQFNNEEPQAFTLKKSRFLCVPSDQTDPAGTIPLL